MNTKKHKVTALKLTDKTSVFPVLHGKAPFSLALRELFWKNEYDCIALAFPEILQEDLEYLVEKLPHIHGLTILLDGETTSYLTVDPCDAFIEGVRQARQRKLPLYLLEDNTQILYKEHVLLPDATLVNSIGVQEYYKTCDPYLKDFTMEPTIVHRALDNSKKIHALENKYNRILFICDYPLVVNLERIPGSIETKIEYLKSLPKDESLEEELESLPLIEIKKYTVEPNHLYFALGELPFYTGEFEKERLNPLALPPEYMDLIKKIFIQTRDHYISKAEEMKSISLTRLQVILQYIRNLAVYEGRLTPDLFEMVTGAKGVLGSYFAEKVLEAAKYYPFFDPFPKDDTLKIGIDKIQSPLDKEPIEALNLMQDEPKIWKALSLKKEPNQDKQKAYKYQWDPQGMCSHQPEDILIEKFNQMTRKKTKQIMQEAYSKSEKFSSSFKDGIDMRETLRHWHTKEIYIKEEPPLKRNVDTIVVIFDSENDEKYPQKVTWYAEHEEESTLTFFATDPFSKMIGPGIAQSEYGGFSLLFPPQPIPNIFNKFSTSTSYSLAEQLVVGACLYSNESYVSYLSFKKPNAKLQRIAKKFKKKLVFIPLSKFSQETLRKLRKFHILNGQEVRSWASRFIPD